MELHVPCAECPRTHSPDPESDVDCSLKELSDRYSRSIVLEQLID